MSLFHTTNVPWLISTGRAIGTVTSNRRRTWGARAMETERTRLAEARSGKAAWRKWGPYLSERQWGTVREDYSESGDAWNYFTHDQARSRAYRWGEDGLPGLPDDRTAL